MTSPTWLMDDPASADSAPDYYARAKSLWPRLSHLRAARLRRDPHHVAALISRRNTLGTDAILLLLGAPNHDTPELGGGSRNG